jgi:hypothetical protein
MPASFSGSRGNSHLAAVCQRRHTATFTLSAEDLALGGRQVTGLPNGVYEVRLMNGNFVRGRTHVIIEGDVLVEPGGDLKAALDALPSGGVILLVNGVSYPARG